MQDVWQGLQALGLTILMGLIAWGAFMAAEADRRYKRKHGRDAPPGLDEDRDDDK